MKCGLLGRNLSHSYSPQIHSMLGDYPYDLFEIELEELELFLKDGDWTGINVTIPYKEAVIPYLDELTPVAQRLGAVNTILRRNRKLIGHNTDYFGFLTMIKNCGLDVNQKKALVLGSGGASKTAAAVLEELGANVTVISRTGIHHYGNLHLHHDAAVLINTTPVGMFPNTGDSPVEVSQFPNLEAVLDVIYNPARTKLLLDAEKQGIPSINGLLMLVAQAKEASEWFTGNPIDDAKITQIHSILRRQMQNLILIGMPGCGKTTVGQLLADHLGKTFTDSDALTENIAGMAIPEIFEKSGEEVFRDYETEALTDLSRRSGLIIATGGGCVKRESNYPLLHQNGTVIWLRRDIAQLPTDGRPLSQAGKLDEMFKHRAPLYETFADFVVYNDGTVSETVRKILEVLQ